MRSAIAAFTSSLMQKTHFRSSQGSPQTACWTQLGSHREKPRELTRWTGTMTIEQLGALFIAWKSGTDLKMFQRQRIQDQSLNRHTDPQATGHSWCSHLHEHASKHGAQVTEHMCGECNAIESFVLGVARLSAKMLTIKRSLMRVLGVVYACDRSRPNLVDAQFQLLISSAFPLALPGTVAHWLVAKFGAISGGRVLVACNSFRMFVVRELLLDHLLTLDGS